MKTGRNAPCPCGSGRKFKLCCQEKSEFLAPRPAAGRPSRTVQDPIQLIQLAMQRHRAGHLTDAEALYRHILQLQPGHPDALHLLGLLAHQRGSYEEATGLLRKAIRSYPNAPHFHNNLGETRRAMGLAEEAMTHYGRALALKPDFAEAHNNLAIAYASRGQLEEALASFTKALALAPTAQIHCNIGRLMFDLGKKEEAQAHYEQALAMHPAYANALKGLGDLAIARQDLAKALALFQKVVALEPGSAEVLHNMGFCQMLRGEIRDATVHFEKAMSLAAGADYIHSSLLFAMLCDESVSPSEHFQAHLAFGERFEAPLRPYWKPHSRTRDAERRLKVGYVSGDFRKHSVAYFMEPVLASHDRSRVESYCYHNSVHADEMTARLRERSDHWIECARMTDDELAERIRRDAIDILVDLSGHTHANRLLVFARKAAPVQVAWLGYAATTGLSAVDYRITDMICDPPGTTEQHYTETLYRLPETSLCYGSSDDAPPVGELPAARRGYITFASFNAFTKVNAPLIELWAKVMTAVPDSRLVLKANALSDPERRARVAEMFSQHGVAADRLELASWDPSYRDHLNRYSEVDIGLDTFPYNGVTTSAEASWMGVPIVTLAGARFVSRMGASIMTNLGLPELVANTEEDYVTIASGLAEDLPRLAELRRGMRERMKHSPLADAQRFTRHLEEAYRNMWRTWCAA